jgi:SAM-dependent methyltransferase
MTSLNGYFSGQKLYGDDFDAPAIESWYADEKEGYAELADQDGVSADSYGYHALNRRHLFRHLPQQRLGAALGLGAAYGGEFLPILDRLDSITILEPSTVLRSDKIGDVPISYADPAPSGAMPFDAASFDVVTSLGVLHHIPNVSHVVSEMARVLVPGGVALIREPVHSMGDWSKPRAGLTKRERGIPPRILLDTLAGSGLRVVTRTWCDSPTMGRVTSPDSARGVLADEAVSLLFAWNFRYHATSKWQKIRPRSMAIVARREC